MQHSLKISQCPEYRRGCSAPVCVLDKHWREMDHLPGEDTCTYLVEAAKEENGIPPVGTHSEVIMVAARAVWCERSSLPYALRKKLVRASKSGSKRASPTLIASAA